MPKGKNYLKYSGLAVQIALTIFLFALLGKYFDDRMENDTPWVTLLLALIGLIGSMIYLVSVVGRDN